MSRCEARRNVTSSPSSRIRPDVGISRPAIMRSVVVLPQPEGPSSTKNELLRTVRFESRTAVKSPKRLCRFSMRISAMALLGEVADDYEHSRAREDHRKGVAVEEQRERLHQHDHARRDQQARGVLPRATPQKPAQEPGLRPTVRHFRTAPNVIPRNRCCRSRKVKITIGIRNSVVAAATAGQSCPPSPMMNGMNGGMVCASPEVSSTAKAYSFQAKIKQKIAVAAMPVEAWGKTTL